ncbi:MAG: PD-(D/E)XK nuclease-like domain-containing protein [Candidatus Roseilinea sp.]|uniref:PD-(D/E)XK nuclease-like domain-containing protein n=1 Tax=Candidatus Roseilinea sp. TaxID=2838777 RepID=UPI0040496F4F
MNTIKPGVYDISHEEYQSGPGISKSHLDLARKAPALVQWARFAPCSHSEAAHIGRALHTLLLEPGEFDRRYAVGPDCERRSNADKARWAEFEAQMGDRIAISPKERETLEEMRQSVMAHPEAAALLTLPSGVAERSVYWIDPETEILCRCRPDWWVCDHNIVVDVKTTDDIGKFCWSVRDFRYDVQQAFYTDGLQNITGRPVEAFLFITIGKKREMGRFPVAVFELDYAAVTRARNEYREDLAVIAECERTGYWPGVQLLEVPPRYN